MASASTSSYGTGAYDNRSAVASNMDINSVISSDSGDRGGGSSRSMHQAPSLAEAPPGSGPRPDEPRSSQYSMHAANTAMRSPSAATVGDDDGGDFGPDRTREALPTGRAQSVSPPRRMETYSTASAADENASQSRAPSAETTSNGYNLPGFSPTNQASQGVFPVSGSDSSHNKRANRRRTGPLTPEQRQRAAIIRRMGACADCRRRRVACNPLHHQSRASWEELEKKYRSNSQDLQEPFAMSSGFQPVNGNSNGNYTHEPQGMQLDQSPPSQQTAHTSPTEANGRTSRTPLPSGPRLERAAQVAAISLPGSDAARPSPQGQASDIIVNPNRGRYSAVHVLLLRWEDEEDVAVKQSVEELRSVLDIHYHYTVEMDVIPAQADEPEWVCRKLSRRIDQFMGTNDHRDALKIFYYSGRTQLDVNRAMVLTSSTQTGQPCVIRWAAVQLQLEQAVADTIVIMDSKYFGVPGSARRQGMIEFLAAGSFEQHPSGQLGRRAFTHALSKELRSQAARMPPISAADLHARLLAVYPQVVQELEPSHDFLRSMPTPQHVQISESKILPSILLGPLRRSRPPSVESNASSSTPGSQVSLTVRLDREPDMETWADWVRLMPDGVRDVRIERR
ncbi:hypothetical protein KVR01_010147 [Diaporthe batatas]|uniref:uncharacterized protein n=1 Tax=Diaporthe batatas TaxID=748121 RepID=UPI001D057651|nr:uncharacterized protein KVR01_010147 [Diaporthe batatas]KAG8159510.1 hypothetical protein KVR01_010147 [Diaporthe batatas]